MDDTRTSARRMTWIVGLLAILLLVLAGAAFLGSCRETADPTHTEAPEDAGAPGVRTY